MAKLSSGVRSGLIGLLFVLACLGIVLTTIGIWAHRTVLVTDRFVNVVDRLVEDPDVQAAAADRIAAQVVVAADVQARLASVLPEPQAFLAAPLTSAIETFLDRRLAAFLATEGAQDAIVNATGFTHARVVSVLRDEHPIVGVTGDSVTLDLLPIAAQGLRALQEAGILPGSIDIPDVTDPATRDATIAALEARLGRDLPADFALVPVADAHNLQTAQGLVRTFDIVVVLLTVITIVLVVATVLLARRRVLMIASLALGAAFGIALARILVRGAVQGLSTSLASEGGDGTVIRDIVAALVLDLATWSWILVLVGLAIGAAVIAFVRPTWTTGDRGLRWLIVIAGASALAWVAASPDVAVLVGVLIVAVAAWFERDQASTDRPTDGPPPDAAPTEAVVTPTEAVVTPLTPQGSGN